MRSVTTNTEFNHEVEEDIVFVQRLQRPKHSARGWSSHDSLSQFLPVSSFSHLLLIRFLMISQMAPRRRIQPSYQRI
jgi:hypothetical protein